MVTRIKSLCRNFFRREHNDAELDNEIRAQLELMADQKIKDGMRPKEAHRAARIELGGVEQLKEQVREVRTGAWLDSLAQDIRFGLRMLRKSPGFTAVAVISLALGLGANAAIFNALYSVLWEPLPVSKPEQLVKVWISHAKSGRDDVPPIAFLRQLRSAGVFEGLCVTSTDGLSFSYEGGRAERVMGEVVSGNYFDLLGVRPIIGQPFTPEVQDGDWAPDAVLSYNFWQHRFGGDPSVIGRTIRLNTYPFTIVGVSPPGFDGLERGTVVDVRIPLLPDGRELAQIARIGARLDRGLYTIARLKPDSSLAQAEASADVQLQEFLRTTTIPQFRDGGSQQLKLGALGNGPAMLGQLHTPLYVLFVLVALVLLIACVNVANMLVARATARSRELALRMSIGASRFRLIRQMLAESLLLALLAGAVAIVIGQWVAGALVHFVPQGNVETVLDLHMNAVTVLFVLALSMVACVAFGLAPAFHSTRCNLVEMLKSDSAASIGNPYSGRFRRVLVASQVAFSLILLIAAGIFLSTMLKLWPTDYGAHPERVLLFTMKPQMEIYTPVQKRALITELVRRVSELPGVEAAGAAEYGPLGTRISEDPESIEAEPGHVISAETDWVSKGFFDAVGLPRVAGRDFTDSDQQEGSPPVVVINQSLAHELFGNANPLGRTIRLTQDKDAPGFEIVGVVGDSRYYSIHSVPQPAVWFTFLTFQDGAPYMPTLFVRRNSGVNTADVAAMVRRELDAIDKGFPIFDAKTLEVRFEESLASERILANLSGAVGFLALALAAVGLYGVLAYSVSRRTREIGIRMALGSNASAVLWLVAREALVLIGVGSLAGLTLSLVGWRLLSHEMPGVSTIDAQVLIACAAIMLILATAAVSIPARRAMRVDPMVALRHE